MLASVGWVAMLVMKCCMASMPTVGSDVNVLPASVERNAV